MPGFFTKKKKVPKPSVDFSEFKPSGDGLELASDSYTSQKRRFLGPPDGGLPLCKAFLAAICRRAWCSRRVGVLGSRVLPGNVRDVRVHPKVPGAKTCTRGGCVSKFYTPSRGARLSVLSGAGSDVSTRSARTESSDHRWLAGMGKVPGALRVRVCTRGCAGQARLDVEFDVEFFSAEKIWSVSQESYAFQSVVLATQKLLLAFDVLPALQNVLHRRKRST